ncbi:MAG: SRPBCC family protein [Candidatus Kariarchaeaceae archaeon]|jgi:uncharacterized protein YndB with AHSA1/START domain
MTDYNWTKFKRKAYIKAPLNEIFDAWTKPYNITTWFIKNAEYTDQNGKVREKDEYAQTGDKYHWEWHQDLQSSGEVLEVIHDKLFRFTFGNKEKGSDEKVVVTVEFNQGEGETEYTLTQENMGGPDLDIARYHLSCNMGWSFFMTNMKAVYENGIDLREHDPKRAMDTRALSL